MRDLLSLVCRRLPLRHGRMTLVIVAALLLAATTLVAVPAPAMRPPDKRAHLGHHHRGSTYARLVHMRRLGRKAPPGAHSRSAAVRGRELPALRTAQSKTFVRQDGTYVARTYPQPVNFRDGRGRFQPIDNRLVPVPAVSRRRGYAFENAANSYRSFLPSNLGSPVLMAAHGSWLSFRLIGADAPAAAAGRSGNYGDALPGVDAQYAPTNQALKETLTLSDANARSSFRYVVHASRSLRPRKGRHGAIAFATRRGKVVFSLAAPFVYDSAQGSDRASYRAVSQRLTRVRGGYLLRLRVKHSWLHAPGRRFPVTVDPTVFHIENTPNTRLEQSAANVDCYIKDGASAGTNLCAGSTQLHLGWDGSTQRRSLLRFDVQNALPKGIHVLDAELGLHLVSADNASSATVNLHRITRSGWTGAASWNSYNGTSAWTAPGGDFDSTVAASNTVGSTSQWYKWFPRQLVQGWVDRSIPNNGVILKEATERSINNRFFFDSSASTFSQLPYLDVVYEPQTGQRPYYKFQGEQLSDRMDLNVNVANGNLLLHASDVNVSGTGLDLGIERFYNSQLERQTDFGQGAGWTMGSGADVRLRLNSDSANFYAPSGYVVSFQKNADGSYSAPKGIDATLCLVNGTTCKGQSTYALTFNHAQIRNNFNSSGKLVSQRDQNDNEISYTYDANGNLVSIRDTQNRTFTVSQPSGRITQIGDPTGRTWQYGYDASNRLASYTDAEGKVTHYGYDATGGELNQIVDPRGGTTNITYDGSTEERVARVERVDPNGPDDVTTYAYSGPSAPCQSSDFGKTVVTDANGHTATYCYDDQGKVGTVFDAKGKKQTTGYDANSFVKTFTSANNASSGFDTSVDRDPASNSVNSVSQATGSSTPDPKLTSSFTYDKASGSSFSPFYPDTSTDTEGHGRSYVYDARGNLKSTADSSSGTHVDVNYDSNHPGWIASVTDGNGHTTTYGHDSFGNVNSIMPPLVGGVGTPLGNTTITYDALARPCVVKDGKGQQTAYTYDKLDRVRTIAKYNSAAVFSVCTTTATPVATVSLTYDENGSLTQRADPNGTSTYAYSALNRLNSQSYPGPRTNTYTYDAVGNLKTLTDAGGTVTYGYDGDNLLASVADPGGSCTASPTSLCTTFNVDDDGNRTKTSYPNGIVLTSEYDPANRLTCVMATNGAPGGNCANVASPLRQFTYNYLDSSGESPRDSALRQSVRDQAANVTGYTYDSLERLKTATTRNSGGTVTDDYTYTYDGAGNMKTRAAKANGGATTTTTFTYNDANELCWSGTGTYTTPMCGQPPAGVTTYTYDANGNQTAASNGRAYSYNVFDQAISLTPPGGTAQGATYLGPNQVEMTQRGADGYGYNVLGIGLKAHSDGTTSYFTRDTNGAVLDERAPGGSKNYYLPDALGSTIAMTGSGGAIVNSYKYDPYGGIVSSNETTAHPNPFRFAGGLFSSSVGLHKFGMRWYDPAIDRWSQEDPIDQTGDLEQGNRYLYAGDDPVNDVDPSGAYDPLSGQSQPGRGFDNPNICPCGEGSPGGGVRPWSEARAGLVIRGAKWEMRVNNGLARVGAAASSVALRYGEIAPEVGEQVVRAAEVAEHFLHH